jgi:hypothetical protein
MPDVQFSGVTIDQRAIFTRNQSELNPCSSRQRNSHNVSEAEALPFFAIRAPPNASIGEHPIHIHCYGSYPLQRFLERVNLGHLC